MSSPDWAVLRPAPSGLQQSRQRLTRIQLPRLGPQRLHRRDEGLVRVRRKLENFAAAILHGRSGLSFFLARKLPLESHRIDCGVAHRAPQLVRPGIECPGMDEDRSRYV